jgi:hypothetical protein
MRTTQKLVKLVLPVENLMYSSVNLDGGYMKRSVRDISNLVARAIAISYPGPSSGGPHSGPGSGCCRDLVAQHMLFLPKNMATAMNARKTYYKKQYILHLINLVPRAIVNDGSGYEIGT